MIQPAAAAHPKRARILRRTREKKCTTVARYAEFVAEGWTPDNNYRAHKRLANDRGI